MYQKSAYDEAIASGLYQKPTGLSGKYDNVRRRWENEVMRLFLQPHVQSLVDRVSDKGLRILDLGCGSGDGYALLMGIKRGDTGLSPHANEAIKPGLIQSYDGIDLNPKLIAQAQDLYSDQPHMSFAVENFNELNLESEHPFDICLVFYGGLSHNGREKNARLLANLAKTGRNGSIIVADWLGRYSYEWQNLWDNDLSRDQWMEYVISYIYPKEEREHRELASLTLALLSRQEVLGIIASARRQSGVKIKVRRVFDRSVLIGRHIDTGDYNPHAQPMRMRVNRLFEHKVRTDLEGLIMEYVPREGFPAANDFYTLFCQSWNTLVQYVIDLLRYYDGAGPKPAVPQGHPPTLRRALSEMRRLIATTHRSEMGDVRANIIEPGLGFALRELEMGLQRGIGCGHGLVTILELEK